MGFALLSVMVSSISKNMRLGQGALSALPACKGSWRALQETLLPAKLVLHLLMEGLIAIPKNR